MKLALALAAILALGIYGVAKSDNSLAISYDCEIPEVGQAVRAWAAVSAIEDGGCSAEPDIRFEFFNNDIGPTCQTNPDVGLIACHRGWYENSVNPYAAILHEVGHTLGLGHYGDCNTAPSVMGCWPIGELTEMDVAAIQYVWPNVEALSRTYRVTVPMVSQ